MSGISLDLGTQCEVTRIDLNWVDENGLRQGVELRAEVSIQDKPRSVMIFLGGDFVGFLEGSKVFIRKERVDPVKNRYKIAYAETIDLLEREVNSLVGDGYRPCGAMGTFETVAENDIEQTDGYVSFPKKNITFFQAMFIPDEYYSL